MRRSLLAVFFVLGLASGGDVAGAAPSPSTSSRGVAAKEESHPDAIPEKARSAKRAQCLAAAEAELHRRWQSIVSEHGNDSPASRQLFADAKAEFVGNKAIETRCGREE